MLRNFTVSTRFPQYARLRYSLVVCLCFPFGGAALASYLPVDVVTKTAATTTTTSTKVKMLEEITAKSKWAALLSTWANAEESGNDAEVSDVKDALYIHQMPRMSTLHLRLFCCCDFLPSRNLPPPLLFLYVSVCVCARSAVLCRVLTDCSVLRTATRLFLNTDLPIL